MRYIYIIGTDRPPYKVGISTNPQKRLRELQTGHPERLHVLHEQPTQSDRTRLLERVIHRHLKHRRLEGEWFDMDLEDLVMQIEFAMIRYAEDPNLRMMLQQNMI